MSNSILAGVMADDGFIAGVEELDSMDSVAAWQNGVELGSAEAEMEVATAAVEVTDTWVGGVESLIEYMEQNVESGMSAGAAEVVGVQMNHMMAQAGIEKRIVAGVESFQGESAAQAATVAGIEEGDNFLKKVWQSIKNAVYRAITAVKNFFAKLFGGWKKLTAKAGKLKEKVDKLDAGFKSKKLEVKNAQHLHVKGSLKPADIAKGFADAAGNGGMDSVADMNEAYIGYVERVTAKLDTLKGSDGVESLDDIKKAKEAIEKKLVEKNYQFPGGIKFTTKTADKDKFVVKDKQSGNEDPAATKQAIGKFLEEAGSVIAPGIEIVTVSDNNIKATKELDEFTKGDLSTIIESIGKITMGAVDKNSDIELLNAGRKKMVDAIDVMINYAEKGKLSSMWDKGKVRILSRMASRDITKPINKFYQKMFSSCRAGISLVEDLV